MMRYSYLGPAGTFTEAALRQIADPHVSEFVPTNDVPSALAMVRNGEVDRAVVPIENSVEGGVSATLDTLSSGVPLVVVAETLVNVTFVLAVRPGVKLDEVQRIATHPHAWAQTRKWVSTNIPGGVHVPATSTAAAVKQLAAGAEYDAAIASPLTAEMYDVDVLADGIEDNSGAVTRFVMVARPGEIPAPTGNDKTTLMVQLPDNEAGALLNMLEQFAVRGVNLSRIESRPTGDTLGRYAFSMDAEGHIADERVAAAMVGLHRVCPLVRFLGSYPRADGGSTSVRPDVSDEAFHSGRAWVAQLQRGIHPESDHTR